MTHKKKIKLARRMRTRKEELDNVPMFSSDNWLKRRKARMKMKVSKKEKKHK